MKVRYKICGITNMEDALAAVDAGADALGFIFYEKSPRYIPPIEAGEIIQKLPPFISAAGVFVNIERERIMEAAHESGIQALQFHGDETVEFCAGWELPVIKAFRVQGRDTLIGMKEYSTSAWLLDAYVPDQPGGTGAKFDWELARQAAENFPRIILAGGLTPANIAAAITQVRPYAVDVSSGVEVSPGRKDHQKMIEFIRNGRAAENI
jgi:phosphoribosylanthranilate isomerase